MNIKKYKNIYNFIIGIIFIMCFSLFGSQSVFGAYVDLSWNANSEADLAGYRIYYGTSSGNYTSYRETGKVTSYTITDLNQGTRYYIAMSAFDASQNESQKSAEISGFAHGAEQCADGIDNDGDGKVDCADSDCSNQTCNDSNLCTSNDRCVNLQCQGTPISCDDGNVCTTDGCNPATGCVYTNNNASCDDGNACTTADTCSGGICIGGPALSCDDGQICTSDSCNAQVGCVYTAIPGCCTQDSDCTDNNLCTGIERCDVVTGSCIPGTPPSCDDGNSCTDDSCNTLLGCVHENNAAPCDDGLFCNGLDTCGDGSCSIHSGDPCKALTCNEESDICEDVGIICDNADTCSSYSGMWGISTGEDTFAGTARTSNKNVTHTWAPEIPRHGFYDVSMWWSTHPKGCKNCPVEIICDEQTVGVLSVDQQLHGGQWNLLGTYGLEAGSTCRIMLKSEGLRKITCADAVKIVYRGESLPEAQISTIEPNPADTGEEIYFEGYGTSSSGKSILGYSWVSDRDGEIGSSDFLYASDLSEGTHQISFSVQDDEGTWSMPVHETLYIGPVEITCDNGDDCTSSTGAWKTLKRADAFNGTSMVLNKKNGTYIWGPYLPAAGYYEVYLWWNSLLSNCTESPVEIACGGVVLDSFAINQSLDGGQWNLLGTYELEKGTSCTVTITSVDYSTTVADAVKFILTENLPNAHILFAE